MEIQSSPCSWQPPPPRRERRRPHANTSTLPSSSAVYDGRNNGSPACAYGHQLNQTTEISQQGIPHVDLPQDVLQHIYSLMPLRDAARAACVSRRFLRFWRCYPNLTFNQETLAATRQPSPNKWSELDRGKYVFRKTKQLLENHSGSGVKALRLNLSTCGKEDIDTTVLDGWLRAFVKPGVTELTVMLPDCFAHEYNFPYSLLSSCDGEAGDGSSSSSSSIQSLYLASCGFHYPTLSRGPRLLGCSRSLSKLCLRKVGVTGDELWSFLSSCFALERLDLSNCDMITSLKIPRVLQKLSTVRVQMCRAMQMIESDAPMLSAFHYDGSPLTRFSLGNSLEAKQLDMHATGMVDMIQYAGSNLPSIAPNLETLVLSTVHEKLKHLVICLGEAGGFGTGYNFASVACFLDACPSLETFILRIADGFAWFFFFRERTWVRVSRFRMVQEVRDRRETRRPRFIPASTGDPGTPPRWPGQPEEGDHHRLVLFQEPSPADMPHPRDCCTVAPVPHAGRLPGYDRKRSSADRCCPMRVDALRDAERALAAVRTCVVSKVPAGVELKVIGPCSRCHAMDAKAMKEAESRIPRSFLQRQADGSIALVIVQPRGTDVLQ